MVFVCDGEQQRYSGGSFHRSALISLFHLQALRSYKHPQSMALWCLCHCVYSEKSGKYVNFKTKGTRMNNGLSGRELELALVKKNSKCCKIQKAFLDKLLATKQKQWQPHCFYCTLCSLCIACSPKQILGFNKQHLIPSQVFMHTLHTRSAHHSPHAVGNKFSYTYSAWADPDPGKKKKKNRSLSAQGLWQPKRRVQEKWNATHTCTHT